MQINRFLGSILMLFGITLGAGILALPLVSAQVGFIWAAILLIAIWALMVYTGLLVLEVNLAFPAYRNSFGTMAKETLGKLGQGITWLTCLALLYALTAAYISGNGSLLSAGFKIFFNFNVSPRVNAFIFTLILGSAVCWSMRVVDHLNRYLLIAKTILLVTALALLAPSTNMALLAQKSQEMKYLWSCAPIFLCAFGYHTIIPSLSNYIGPHPRFLKYAIIIGATLPLLLYLAWIFTTLTIVPLEGKYGFLTFAQSSDRSIGTFIYLLDQLVKNRWVNIAVNSFSNIAMTTSFLGVTLGLFDFLADSFKRLNTRRGRMQTAFLTFIPPLLFAWFYPQGFILALGYAAIFVAVLEIILPACMVWRLRKSTQLNSPYRAFGGKLILIVVSLVGVLLIVTQIISRIAFHL